MGSARLSSSSDELCCCSAGCTATASVGNSDSTTPDFVSMPSPLSLFTSGDRDLERRSSDRDLERDLELRDDWDLDLDLEDREWDRLLRRRSLSWTGDGERVPEDRDEERDMALTSVCLEASTCSAVSCPTDPTASLYTSQTSPLAQLTTNRLVSSIHHTASRDS